MKIMLIGGHPTPALALAEEIKRDKKHEIVWVGRSHLNRKERAYTLEYTMVTNMHIPFINFDAERGMRGLFELPYSVIRAYILLRKQTPQRIMGFGGYISLPFACAAWIAGIPFFVHEQVIVPGIANRIGAYCARETYVSFPETRKLFPRSVTTGNLLRTAVFTKYTHLPTLKPLMLVMGGNMGSHLINTLLFTHLPNLIKQYDIVHIVGNISRFGDFNIAKAHMQNYTQSYRAYTHLGTDEYVSVLQQAHIIISRAGANTFFELIAAQKPAILVPLALSRGNEQLQHARLFENVGAGILLEEQKAQDTLLSVIHMFEETYETMCAKCATLKKYVNQQSAHTVYTRICDTRWSHSGV